MAVSKLKRRSIFFWLLLLAVVVIVVAPLYWMVVTSLKTPREVIRAVPTLFPEIITFENYRTVVTQGIWGNFYNSVIVTGAATLLSIILAFLSSYALARYRFPFQLNKVFLIWVLVVRILPPIVLAVPLFTILNNIGIMNTLTGLVVSYQLFTLPYAIWIIFGFVKSLPLEFEQAATIDGASPARVLVSIVAPLVQSGLVATSIFALILAWNEFLFALLFVRTPRLLTLPVVVARFIGEYATLWGELMAIGLLSTLPILLFSNYVYRRLTEGFSLSLR